MSNWFGEQWKQIRGNFKYELVRSVFIALGGAGLIATVAGGLQRLIGGADKTWFVYGGTFAFSLLIFSLGLRRSEARATSRTSEGSADFVSNYTVSLRIGEFRDIVSASTGTSIRVELKEMPEATKAEIGIGMMHILYWGRRVVAHKKDLSGGIFLMPRATYPGEGEDSVFGWDIGEGYFYFFSLYVDHINPHAKEVVLQLWFATPFPYKTETVLEASRS